MALKVGGTKPPKGGNIVWRSYINKLICLLTSWATQRVQDGVEFGTIQGPTHSFQNPWCVTGI